MPDLPANPYDGALASLRSGFPVTFHLEVEQHVFLDLPSVAEAQKLSAAMEGMKEQAVAMGYRVTTKFDQASQRWIYDFKRSKGVFRPGRDADVQDIKMPARPLPTQALPEPKQDEEKEQSGE